MVSILNIAVPIWIHPWVLDMIVEGVRGTLFVT